MSTSSRFPRRTRQRIARGERSLHVPYDLRTQVHHRVLARLAKKYGAGGRVLDVGCGLGHTLHLLSRSDPTIVLFGADADAHCLEQVGARVPSTSLIPMRADRIDIENLGRDYDVVTMAHVLEHLPRPLETVQDLLDIVAPAGHLILAVPNLGTPLKLLAGLLRQHRVNTRGIFKVGTGHTG